MKKQNGFFIKKLISLITIPALNNQAIINKSKLLLL